MVPRQSNGSATPSPFRTSWPPNPLRTVADFEFSPHSNLHAVEIKDFPIKINYYIAHLAERQNSPKIRAFIEIIKGKKDWE